MEKETENSVLQHFTFNDTNLNGVVVECERPFGRVIHVLFTINGKRHHIKVQSAQEINMRLNVHEAMEILYKSLTEAIANELMPPVLREALKVNR
jgi:hypothetical protein